MAFLLSTERPDTTASGSRGLIGTALAWLSHRRAIAKQRRALQSLLELDESRLDDLGIDRGDVLEALERGGRPVGPALSQRRAASARLWREG